MLPATPPPLSTKVLTMAKDLRVEEEEVAEEEEASECSSGCESGWTMYLDQSADEKDYSGNDDRLHKEEEEWEEEEDLSMVSDASSGPPHLLENDDLSYNYRDHCDIRNGGGGFSSFSFHPPSAAAAAAAAALSRNGAKRRRVESVLVPSYQQPDERGVPCDLLDDTASSPLLSKHKTNVDLSIGRGKPLEDDDIKISYDLSAAHFKGKSISFHRQLGHQKPKPTCREEDGKRRIW